nr:unnamed protein product [Digitaria exilis]
MTSSIGEGGGRGIGQWLRRRRGRVAVSLAGRGGGGELRRWQRRRAWCIGGFSGGDELGNGERREGTGVRDLEYESVGLDDSLEDERNLDEIIADRRAAEAELDAREVRTGATADRKLPRMLDDQDTDEDMNFRRPKRHRTSFRPPSGPRTPRSDDDGATPSSPGRSQRGYSGGDVPMTDQTDDDPYETKEGSVQGDLLSSYELMMLCIHSSRSH